MSRATLRATLLLGAMVALAAALVLAAALQRTAYSSSLGCPACRSAE